MISVLRETPFHGVPAPYPASCRVNAEWSTIISPMRTQFIRQAEFEHRPAEFLPCEKLYFPFEGEKVEYSGFWMQPTQLDFAAEVCLLAPQDGEYPFLLAAFGGVKVYVNGVLCQTLFSYLRNQEQKTTLSVPLRQGRNTLYIQCNDLAERDTMAGFRLRYDGEALLTCNLPASVDAEMLQRVYAVLSGAYLDKFNYGSPDITIRFPQPLAEALELDVALQFADAHIPNAASHKTICLQPGDGAFSVGDLITRAVGLVKIVLTAHVSGWPVARALQMEYYDTRIMDSVREADIEKRRRNTLAFLAQHGTANFQNALAILETGADEQRAHTIIEQELERINSRFDCSDFRMPAFFYALKSEHVSADIKERLRDTILNFRYWFDEPGTDVMWFFSENHALCFHTCELLAGEFFPQRVFLNSGMTGDEHRRKAKRLLTAWFDKFMRWGFSEWNSAVYIPIDVIGMVALYDMTIDPEIRHAAKLALDKTFDILARNSFHGIVAASYGRIYFKNLIGRRTSEASALNFILSGEGWLNQHCFSTVLLALSHYQPATELLALYGASSQGVLNESIQGEDQVHLYSYKTPDYILASALGYCPGQPGQQEHVLQLMIRDCDTQIWINHPGEAVFFGEGRPSYFAGNGTLPCVTQYKNTAQLVFDLLDQEVDYTHAYCPLACFDAWKLDGCYLYARKEHVWVALYAENGLTITEGGPLNQVELRSPGRHNIWRVFVQTLAPGTCVQTFAALAKQAMDAPEIRT